MGLRQFVLRKNTQALLGELGVGKTELCKALAEFLFDSQDHLIRIDKSVFMEKHSVARLIGAPPGYVGYEEGGYQVIKLAVMGEVKSYFRPEFINRIDEVVVFHALGEAHIANIARIQLRYLEQRVAQMDMKLEVSDAALMELAREGFDPLYGARPLKRAIQQQIENPLAKEILSGHFAPKDVIRVDVENGRIVFEQVIEAEAA